MTLAGPQPRRVLIRIHTDGVYPVLLLLGQASISVASQAVERPSDFQTPPSALADTRRDVGDAGGAGVTLIRDIVGKAGAPRTEPASEGAVRGIRGATDQGSASQQTDHRDAVVQTFLPYPDFAASAAVLDYRRLGKQRVEALQVLRAVTRAVYGWKRHPVVRMWVTHPEGVAAYGLAVCHEWVQRGHSDTCAATISADLARAGFPGPRPQRELARAQPTAVLVERRALAPQPPGGPGA